MRFMKTSLPWSVSVRVVQVPLVIHLTSSGLQRVVSLALTASPFGLLIVCTADLIAALFTSAIGETGCLRWNDKPESLDEALKFRDRKDLEHKISLIKFFQR
jgi:hypothetical protein